MSRCIEKIKHSCGSYALQIFEKDGGGYDGYCFACSTYEPNPYGDKPPGYSPPRTFKSQAEVQQELSEVGTYPTVDLPERKLKKSALSYFGIKIGLSETDGVTPNAHYYPYYIGDELIGYKCRIIENKKMWAVGTTKGADFFGWNQAIIAGGKKLFITEGECFPPETQVFTPAGWVSLDKWDGQPVMSESGFFEMPLAKVEKDFDGDLVEYHSGSYRSVMTPGHNMLRVFKGVNTKFRADDLSKKHLNVPRTVKLPYGEDIDDVNARLQVMLSADFTFRKEGDLYGAFKKQRKIDRVSYLLDTANVRYTKGTSSNGHTSFFIHRGHGLDVSKLFSYERDLKDAYTILDEIVHWDGNIVPNRDQIEYSTKELHNAEFIQTLSHLCGYVSTIIRRSNKFGSWYKVSILFSKQTSSTQKGYTQVPYKGKVHCLTMPSGTLLVRYKESISLSGNCDAVALFQIMKDHNAGTAYADLNPAVVSLSNGAGGAAKQFAKMLPEIRKHFKEIVLVFDNDEPGRKATEDVIRICPEAVVASLPAKDANECLIQGRSKAAYSACVFNAIKPKNTRLVTATSVISDARKEAEWGYSYPYPALTDITRGQRLGETVYWGAGVKMGKSELLNDLVAHNILEHGWKVFVIKPEESNKRTLQGVVGKVAKRIFHDPKIPFDYEAFDEAVPKIEDKLFMMNLYQELSWEALQSDIRSAALEGCKAIYIDPITVLTNGVPSADANTLLQKFAQGLAQMAMDLNIIVHIFCHLKAPDTGPSHERGGAVQSHQFAGSRAMMRACNSMIGMEGNKDPDLSPEERNIRTVVVLEDRATGSTGKVKLFYDQHTGAFNQIG